MTDRRERRKATIYDIAEAANASAATVSMVLNGTWQRYRISEATASRILETAKSLRYNVNRKARALRLSRSGLAGMVIPHYRNRFFAGLAETFEASARGRGYCPVVVSTQRDRATEREVIETLLSQQVEFLFITGVAHPDPLNDLCRAAGVPCVNVDLPGSHAPSVVTDNRGSARMLGDAMLERMRAQSGIEAGATLHFIGGVAGEHATEERIAGFLDSVRSQGFDLGKDEIRCCGYMPATAKTEMAMLYARVGTAPAGLFVNSITALEGVVQFLNGQGAALSRYAAIGCFDWDPFAASLPYPITMMRQDVEAIVDQAFVQIDDYRPDRTPVIRIPARLRPPDPVLSSAMAP
jgi:LacI family transcriptional regulator, fructose operon transcriptional repressor